MICVFGLCLVLEVGFLFAATPVRTKCGYESCQYDPGVLNVHIVAHTHNDVGWVNTIDEYFNGTGDTRANVSRILDAVIEELWKNPKRRFTYVETFYFFKWWELQSEEIKDRVRTLVEEGRLQFAGGAWSMNDEATTHYQSIVDQFTLGLSMLNETLGPCGVPRVGWQIDTFGHSREFASLLAAMGYDGLIVGRIDNQDLSQRRTRETKKLEMLWRGDHLLGRKSDIFTSVLFNTFDWPKSYCFDEKCGQQLSFIDDPKSPDFNIIERVKGFIGSVVNFQGTKFRTNNILVPMGGDFHYQNAERPFKYIDSLIEHTNIYAETKNLSIKMFYSSPQCYVKAVHDANPVLPIKEDDFLPYADEDNQYWTGFYTSRPTVKYLERLGNSCLQMVKQLQVLANLDAKNLVVLNKLRSAMGILQHHDAITGTHRHHVSKDYVKILKKAIKRSLVIPREAFNKYMRTYTTHFGLSLKMCDWNLVSCEESETGSSFVVTVYNQLGWRVWAPVRVPVRNGVYEVFGPNGDIIKSQLIQIPKWIKTMPGRRSRAVFELIFIADLKPVSYKNYYVQKSRTQFQKRRSWFDKKIYFNLSNAFSEANFTIKYGYYEGTKDDVYTLMPEKNEPNDIDIEYSEERNGPVAAEISIMTNKSISSVLRAYDRLSFIENDWVVGPIDVEDQIGKQYVVNYATNLVNNETFYTDSNGRQMIKRKLNFRDSYTFKIENIVAGNYFPVTNEISINNDNVKISVLTDRAQGGTSLRRGEIELMLHRRLLHDEIGIGELLDETINEDSTLGIAVRGRHRIVIGKNNEEYNIAKKKLVKEFHLEPQVFVSNAFGLTLKKWLGLVNEYSWLVNDLREGLHLLTIEPFGDSTVLLRFENYLDEDTDDAKINVDMNMFKTIDIVSFRESTLAANMWVEDKTHWNWKTETKLDSHDSVGGNNSGSNITVKPREIRTFIARIGSQVENSVVVVPSKLFELYFQIQDVITRPPVLPRSLRLYTIFLYLCVTVLFFMKIVKNTSRSLRSSLLFISYVGFSTYFISRLNKNSSSFHVG